MLPLESERLRKVGAGSECCRFQQISLLTPLSKSMNLGFSMICMFINERWPLMVGRPGGGQTLGNFYRKYYCIIGLKAPGYYSAQIGLIKSRYYYYYYLKTKFQNIMISGFLDPHNPVSIHFIIEKCFRKCENNYRNALGNYYFGKAGHQQICFFWKLCVPNFLNF